MDNQVELKLYCEKLANTNAIDVPDEINIKLKEANNTLDVVLLENINHLFNDANYDNVIGYKKMLNGGWYVAMSSPMPNVTKEMINWWFWWHAQDKIRYKMWYPQSHYNISYSSKNKSYFTTPYKHFEPNTQYPSEIIGSLKAKLSIQFVTPKEFGFDADVIKNNNIETIVCGHVGFYKPAIQHTSMCHLFKKTEFGVKIISRFWMANNIYLKHQPNLFVLNKILNTPFVKSKVMNAQRAKEMAEHCCVEYRNLAKFLPELYSKFHK